MNRNWALLIWVPIALFTTNVQGTDALGPRYQKCLTGRCSMGECNPKKMPHYSLGLGYTCDLHRIIFYEACRSKGTSIQSCLILANSARTQCKKNPCPIVHQQCLDEPCTRKTNLWPCWRDTGEKSLSFGYEDIDENGVEVFRAVPGDQVPPETWQKVCLGKKQRCEKSLTTPTPETIIPISSEYCSAKCYGHNCHHAVADVCKCLRGEGVRDIGVLVFDEGKTSKEIPMGNLYHSVLIIPHPDQKKAGVGMKCLLESQVTCEESAFDPNCCFSDEKSLRELSPKQCSLVSDGPLKVPEKLDEATLYTQCETFLRERGTRESEVHPGDRLRYKIIGPSSGEKHLDRK